MHGGHAVDAHEFGERRGDAGAARLVRLQGSSRSGLDGGIVGRNNWRGRSWYSSHYGCSDRNGCCSLSWGGHGGALLRSGRWNKRSGRRSGCRQRERCVPRLDGRVNLGRGGQWHRRDHGVDELGCQRLFGRVPMVFAIGQQYQGGGLVAGAGGIAGRHRFRIGVQHVGLLAQIDRIAPGVVEPGRMDHHQRVVGHLNGVTGHRDQAGDRGGHAVDDGGHVRLVTAQRVEDGDAVRDRTTIAVDAHGDLIDIQRGDLAHEILGGDRFAIPGFADVTVDQDLGGRGRRDRPSSTAREGTDIEPLGRYCLIFLRGWHVRSLFGTHSFQFGESHFYVKWRQSTTASGRPAPVSTMMVTALDAEGRWQPRVINCDLRHCVLR